VEELLMRGIVFRQIEEMLGTWSALLLSAILFGAMRARNPGADAWSTTAIALETGVVLGAAFVLTRQL
jgi:membrane protease YdiL (CAAX protease family)